MSFTTFVKFSQASTHASRVQNHKLPSSYRRVIELLGFVELYIHTGTKAVYITPEMFAWYHVAMFSRKVRPLPRKVLVDHNISFMTRHIVTDPGKLSDHFRASEYNLNVHDHVKSLDMKKKVNRPVKKAIRHMDALINRTEHTIACVMDFEMYERKQRAVTEIGIDVVDVNNNSIIDSQHIIIEEHVDFRNGKYVPDHKDHYQFGESRVMSLRDATKHLESVLSQCCIVVTHGGGKSDHLALQQFNLKGIDLVDVNTDSLHRVLTGIKRQFKLKSLADQYNIGTSGVKFHNAGNDSHITAQIFIEMCKLLREPVEQVA